jgi:hypothetical protein
VNFIITPIKRLFVFRLFHSGGDEPALGVSL